MSDAVKQFPVKLPADDWKPPEYKRGGGPDWSDAEMEELERLRLAGYRTPYIARRLNRSPQAVRLKLWRKRIVMEPHRPAHRRKVG